VRRPWNLVNQAVYSLATYADGRVNMNICTYVTAISMKPKLYAVAVYHNTLTLKRLQNSSKSILQLLSIDQINLVRKLGKSSGFEVDKHDWLHSNKHLTKWKNHEVLKDSCAFLELETHDVVQTVGDHDLYVFNVSSYSTKRDEGILSLQDLINQKIIL
jgi:flavin reductase (DIM6/NTAB) family NADH-FMN oxidoreductase RutF